MLRCRDITINNRIVEMGTSCDFSVQGAHGCLGSLKYKTHRFSISSRRRDEKLDVWHETFRTEPQKRYIHSWPHHVNPTHIKQMDSIVSVCSEQPEWFVDNISVNSLCSRKDDEQINIKLWQMGLFSKAAQLMGQTSFTLKDISSIIEDDQVRLMMRPGVAELHAVDGVFLA